MISALADKTILTPYHHQAPGSNGKITRVVMHGTVSPCVVGGAEANAHYFQNPSAGGAAHYIGDPATIVCSVDEDCKAAHAPPNAGSIGIELCDPQSGDGARWGDADHLSMLELVAKLTADICDRHQLPLVWLSARDLLDGKTGITSHANVAQAWHQTDHTDPGPDFPVDVFLALVDPQQPTPKPKRGKVIRLIKPNNGPAVYATDLITRRWIPSEKARDHILAVIVADGGPADVAEWEPADVDAIPLVGPAPH